jgi:hypothetical protein
MMVLPDQLSQKTMLLLDSVLFPTLAEKEHRVIFPRISLTTTGMKGSPTATVPLTLLYSITGMTKGLISRKYWQKQEPTKKGEGQEETPSRDCLSWTRVKSFPSRKMRFLRLQERDPIQKIKRMDDSFLPEDTIRIL